MTPSESTPGRDRSATTDSGFEHAPGSPDPTTQRPRSAPSTAHLDSTDSERTHRKRSTEDEYLSAGDAARLLCVSARTVSRWADQGRIPHLITLGGHRRFNKATILELTRNSRRDIG